MIKTEIGDFDGDSWEDLCQICFQLKYENEGYQEITAHSNGDLGIEGYTRTGKVFQCYCPDAKYDASDLYEKQRDKINKDLNKLIKNKEELKKYLGNSKIKTWYFITPYYLKKDIVKYCVTKAKQMRELELDILDPEFDVLINNCNFIARELPEAMNMRNVKVNVNLEKDISEEDIKKFRESKITGINNLSKKSIVLIPKEKVRNKFIENEVRNYLKGKMQINLLDSNYKIIYEKIVGILSSFEDDVEETCMFECDDKDGRQLIKDIQYRLEKRLIDDLGDIIDSTLIDSIKRYAISDWLIRCPLEVEVEG